MTTARILPALLLAGSLAIGQNCTPANLVTTFAAGNGQNGNMFDVRAVNPSGVTICSFDIHYQTAGGGGTVQIYARTGGGSYVGGETNAAVWTLLGSATVTGAGAGLPTSVPVSVGISIPAGATQGFYVTFSTGQIVGYTNGTALGAVAASDSNIEFLQGVGIAYPFAGTFSPRIFNGRINYCVGVGANCPANPAPAYQPNSPNSSLSIDGVQTTTLAPAVTTICAGGSATFTAATALVGTPAEIAVTPFAPLVPGPSFPALLTASGSQVVNVNLTSPGLFFLFGGATAALVPHPGTLSFPVSTPFAFLASAQQVVIDPSNIDLIRLSQGATLDVSVGAGAINHALTDDSFVNVVLANQPLCSSSAVQFFGTVFTQFNVVSNGRVQFGLADVDFSPTVAEALADAAFVGGWTDLNPGAGGTVATSTSAGVVTVAWTNVPYFGTTIPTTFNVQFDTNTGAVTIGSINTITSSTGSMFLGICGGTNVGATDAGAANFTLNTSGITPNATDAIYDFGPAGSLATGRTTITFFPNAFANYDWLAL